MKTTSQSHPIRKVLLWVGGLIVALVLVAFVGVSLWIGADVRAMSKVAMQNHPGDRVEALIQYVEDTNHSLQDRNRAVWALGQLGDRRALPILRNHHSGEPCDHATALCQHELSKAIALLDGGVNATALVWRH